MDEQPIVGKRGRSRSNTPFLRSSCDHENCTEVGEHLQHERKKSPVKKIPKVQTITEETEIVSPGVTTTKRTSRQVVTTVISSDYSSDDTSTSTVKNNAIQTTAVIKNTPKLSETNKIVASTSTSSSSAGNMATATSSASQYNLSKQQQQQQQQQRNHINAINTNRINTYMETSQNEENKFFELNQKYKTSTPVVSGNNQSPIIDISNGNLSDHIAYKEYKAAGEYWNKYPKTDYTYSKLSPHRRELAPGVVAMPNMSRQSLQHHSNRVDQMALRNPHEEAYIRKRYLATNYDYQTDHQTQFSANNYYDSQDEVDIKDQLEEYARNRKYLMSRYKTTTTTTTSTAMQKESIFRRILTTIYTVYYSVVNIFTNSSENKYRYTRMEEKGFFGRISSSIKRSILSVFRYIYLFISSVTYWDTWLLQTSNADNRIKKRFLLFLLLLLPFLLLGAWHQTDESERNLIYTKLPVLSQSVPLAATLNTFNGYKKYVSDYLKNIYKIIFDFNWNPLFSSSQINYNQYSQNIKQSLSDQQYKDLLNHINGYIEKVVIEKLQQNNNNNDSKLSPKLSILLASTVKEQLSLYKYELTDSDIEKIAESVRIKLMANNSEFMENIPFKISQNNIEELSQVIKENLVYQKSAADVGGAAADYDVNEIIYKIFASPKLIELIDQRLLLTKPSIKAALIEEQQLFVNNLVNDINFVKNQLSEQLTDNGNIEFSLNLLKTDQDKLSNEFLLFQNMHNERLEKLLNEIDIKINSLGNKQFSAINDHVKLVLLEVIGYKLTDGKTLNDIDIKNWIRNIFVAKEFLEERLIELNDKLNKKIQDEKDKMAALLMTEITNNIKKEVLIVIEQNNEKLAAATSESTANYVKGSLDESVIKRIVKDALAVYDADKTGLVDYALESAGGEVLSTRCTEGFQTKTAQISIFGIPLWYQTNTPRTAISPTVRPGECWAFLGFPGFLVLKLNHEVLVTGFTIEHIPKSLSPNGKIESAPRQFTVWGLNAENDPEPVEFGKYEYKENGTSLQYFHVENININHPYNIVELRIESNHGNENYTCLYRFRVHGHPPPAPKPSPSSSQSDSTKT